MNAHTPGPWKAHVMTREVSVEAPCGRVLYCVPVESDEEAVADARLIAAAPEMLEALRWYASVDGDTRAAAIVTKATGENV